MPLVLPNPTVPTNGQSLDATPVLQNLLALAQAIQSFDGSQVAAGSIVAAALNASINPNTLLNETTFPFVASGLVWSVVSGLNGTMTGGTIYYNGLRVTVNSVASNAFAASKDTYIDVDVNGNITYQAVTTNAASPSITANSIRIGICVTGASITSFNQGSETAVTPIISSVALSVVDSLGNLIYPKDPNRKVLGYRRITSTFTSTTVGSYVDIPGLSVPVIIPAGRKIKIVTGGYYRASSQAAGNGTDMDIQEDATTEICVSSFTTPVANYAEQAWPSALYTPTAGSHSYKARVIQAAVGTITIAAAATAPTYILVELV